MLTLHKSHTKKCLKLALPVMITQLGQVSVQIFDNIIVGKLLGSDALAAVSLGNGVFYSALVLCIGFSLALPPLVSEANAEHNSGRIKMYLNHALIINLVFGLLLSLALLLFIPMLPYLKQPEKILPDTKDFLQIMALSVVPFMVFQTFREFSEGMSHTLNVTKATILANIINIALNYVLIKGMFGFPEMGVKGSATATLISRIVMLVFLLWVLWRDKRTQNYIRNMFWKIDQYQKGVFIKLTKMGTPIAFQLFFEVSAFAAAAFICGLISADDIAAHQITLSLASLTFNLCMGFSVASTIMVGEKLGQKDYIGIREVGINNIKLVFLFMFLCGIIFIVFRHQLPYLFAKEHETLIMGLAAQLLIIAALFQLSDGIQVVCIGSLRGLQDVTLPSIITFIAYWLLTLPLGYYLCYTLQMGAFGMWIALGLGLSISAILLVMRFLNLTKDHKAPKIEF